MSASHPVPIAAVPPSAAAAMGTIANTGYTQSVSTPTHEWSTRPTSIQRRYVMRTSPNGWFGTVVASHQSRPCTSRNARANPTTPTHRDLCTGRA